MNEEFCDDQTMSSACFAAGMFSVAQAARCVTADNAGEASEQYFGPGHSCLIQGGQPVGVDRAGNCWFVADGQIGDRPQEQMFAAERYA